MIFGRKNRKMMTDAEVVTASGLTLDIVKKIGNELTWNNVPVWQVEKFCRACNHDPVRPSESLKYLRRVAIGKITMTHLNQRQKLKLTDMYRRLHGFETGADKQAKPST